MVGIYANSSRIFTSFDVCFIAFKEASTFLGMTLGGRVFCFTSAATVRQFLEL